MCGFAGWLSSYSSIENDSNALLVRMTQSLRHRGPDDKGTWYSDKDKIGLAFNRLAIHDLTRAGHQPMFSYSKRYVMVFNGEIYNYKALRAEVNPDQHFWKSDSDSEVLLACIEKWGVKQSLLRLNGMFAFAVWDREEKKLFLARDRIGIKPLYYSFANDILLFGSEVKAIKLHPCFKDEIDSEAIIWYLRYKQIPTPYTIYKSVRKLTPGHYIEVITNSHKQLSFNLNCYWSLGQIITNSLQSDNADIKESEAYDRYEALLNDSVRLRMAADVPLGAFLSGGIDSSLIVALMQRQSASPINTFTIGFNEKEFNEAESAKKIAQYLGTHHTELYVTANEALDVIPKLPIIYDEPFSDISQIPTFLVSQLAKQQVTVALSGDGGDELFGGYTRYFKAHYLYNKINYLPQSIRLLLVKLLEGLPPDGWGRLCQFLNSLPFVHIKDSNIGIKLAKLAKAMKVDNLRDIYDCFVTVDTDPVNVVRDSFNNSLNVLNKNIQLNNTFSQMMYWDTVHYLPDDILTKVDRASMSVGLETRVPLLDHRLIEYVWQIPFSYKINNNQGKLFLKKLLGNLMPLDLFDRPKSGFSVPLKDWLRGPLKSLVMDLLSEKQLNKHGLLNNMLIRQRWQQHLKGVCNWEYFIWSIMVFQLWYLEQ